MPRLVYGCRFDILGNAAWDTVVKLRYQNWISDRYRKAFNVEVTADLASLTISGLMPEGHLLEAKQYGTSRIVTQLEWAFPGEHGLVWRNLMRAAQLDDRCAVEHRVEIASAEYSLSPAGYTVGAPTVIRGICQQNVLVGEMQVRATVYPLTESGVDQFVELLEARQRRLPIVLLTPFANGEPGELDRQALADQLAGVAVVTEADTPATTRLLSDRLARLGCYDGSVRVYWPGFNKGDDLRRHPLMFGSRIAIVGPQRAARTIQRSIFSVAAFRFAPDARISTIIAESEAVARAERAQEAVGQGDATWESYALEMSEERDAALAELEILRAENENLRANQSVLFAFSGQDEEEQDDDNEMGGERDPTSVREAVEFAEEDLPRLQFLDSSFSSAEQSPFVRPREIYETLATMNAVADVWAKNQGGGDLRLMLRDAGLGKRVSNFISQTAKGKWGHEYSFTYDGRSQLFEWHVTLGAGAADTCASIHFLPAPEVGKLIIGHVGRHLTNTRS